MKSKINQFGVVAVTALMLTIVSVSAMHNNSSASTERRECQADEVFRWSDQTCYVPQGE